MNRASSYRFIVEDFEPAYVRANGTVLRRRADHALHTLAACQACPRACDVNRANDEHGVCETGRYARVSSAAPHHGEERCLSGTHGSGTIFFSLCNLKCVFCQNADISHFPSGELLNASELAEIMLRLQECGCHNINFVSPSHVVPQILDAVADAASRGLQLPLVYNSNAYDTVETLRQLDGIVDIYMPDFKFWSPETAYRLCHAKDYPERAREAIREMHQQVGDLRWDEAGLAKRGVLVRHLVMPGQLDQSEAIFRWLAENVSHDTFINIMGQYRPAHRVGRQQADASSETGPAFPEINRRPRPDELEQAYELARRAGLWRFDK